MLKPLYVHIPKNAGTAIGLALEKNYSQTESLREFHGNVDQTIARAKELKHNWNTLFTTVRNPFDRFVSIYNHIRYTRAYVASNIFDSIKKWNFENFIKKFFEYYEEEKIYESKNPRIRTRWYDIPHWFFIPQSYFIENYDVKVFKYENLSEVCNFLKIDKLVKANVRKENEKSFVKFNDYLIEKILHHYDVDFTNFNYERKVPQC